MNNKVIFIFLITLSCATQASHAANISWHEITKHGDYQSLQTLINNDLENINTPDEDGLTPLHYAAYFSHLECIDILLQHGAKVNALNRYECTPLHLAAGKKSIDCLKLLVEHGATINHQDIDLWTPLHKAAVWGQLECVQYLVEKGANIFATTNTDQTPKEIATTKGHQNVADYLQLRENLTEINNYWNANYE
ncbi:ankyrin repeat domain-containing protein [bacterium]|nr:MAG: ankyrin repeat domain-containing protein [bacterium]